MLCSTSRLYSERALKAANVMPKHVTFAAGQKPAEDLSLKPALPGSLFRQNMQQNLKSTSESLSLILLLAHVATCSVVTVMIHESNTKHCFFGAWSPRSRRPTTHICFKCITFPAELVQVTGPCLFEQNFFKAGSRVHRWGPVQCFTSEKLRQIWIRTKTAGVTRGRKPWPGFCVKEVGR